MSVSSASSSPDPTLKRPCYVCGTLTSKGCRECGKVYYCSSQHAAHDRKRHEFECQPFDKIANQWLANLERGNRSKSRTTLLSDPKLKSHKSKSRTFIEEDIVPISTPSHLKEPRSTKSRTIDSKAGSKKSKRGRSKDVTKTQVRAFLFPIDKDDHVIVDVPCSTVDHPASFEGPFHRAHYRSIIGKKAAEFRTVETYRGIFLVIRPADEVVEEEGLLMNRCIYEMTGGEAKDWPGNVLVIKEASPKSEMVGDIDPKDIDVLIQFFRLEGNAPDPILRRALWLSPETIDKTNVDEEGYPFPSTPGPSRQVTVDVLIFPGTTPYPKLLNIPLSPLTGRPTRPDYTAILGPDPIFNTIETYAGTYIVGCRPRFGYEGERIWNADDDEEEEEYNICLMHMTHGRRGDGWKRWPRANIMVMKSVDLDADADTREGYGSGSEDEEAPESETPKYKDATMFDIPVLVRYFELAGTIPEHELRALIKTI